MQVVRAVCAILAGTALAASIGLASVALLATWWIPTKSAFLIMDGINGTVKDGVLSEITLWGNIGCGGNESWNNICSLTIEDPALQACIGDSDADSEAAEGEWRPPPPATTTPFLSPTLDPKRNMGKPAPPTEDPDAIRAREKAEERKKQDVRNAVTFGDAKAYPVEGGTVTAEKPPTGEKNVMIKTTTAAPTKPRKAIGKKLDGSDDSQILTPVPNRGFLGNIFHDHVGPKSIPEPPPLAETYHPLASPKISTTKKPDVYPGLEEVVEMCPITRSGERAMMFVCQLISQCSLISQAKIALITALVFLSSSAFVLSGFKAGGGGVNHEGTPQPTKHVLGFLSCALSVGGTICLFWTLSVAGGVNVPHSLDGTGYVCASAASGLSLFSALVMLNAANLAHKYPGRPASQEKGKDDKKQFGFDSQKHELEKDFPGLKHELAKTLPVRTAWQPTFGEADEEDEPSAAAENAKKHSMEQLVAVSPEDLPDPSEAVVCCMPEEVTAIPAAEKTLTSFFLGEGSVYAHTFYAAQAESSPTPPMVEYEVADVPDGWTSAVLPDDGRIYYYNQEAGTSQWEHPLFAGWEAAVSSDFGDTYYVNSRTGESQWEFPPSPGWSTDRSPRNGSLYYCNNRTGERQRQHPLAVPASGDDQPQSSRWGATSTKWAAKQNTSREPAMGSTWSGTPVEWVKKRSKKTGQVYMVAKKRKWAEL